MISKFTQAPAARYFTEQTPVQAHMSPDTSQGYLGFQQTRSRSPMRPILYVAAGAGLLVGLIFYLVYYTGGDGMSPALGLLVTAGVGIGVGLSYYLVFKLALRRFILPFMQQAQQLPGRTAGRLPWFVDELDEMAGLLTGSLAALDQLDKFGLIIKGVVGTLDSTKVLKQIVNTAVESLPADGGILFLLDPEIQRYTARAFYPLRHQEIERETFALGDIVPDWSGPEPDQRCIIASAKDHPGLHPAFAQLGIRSLLNTPLVTGNRVVGLLSLFNRVREHAFDENDLRLACVYADVAAIALTNARRYQEVQDEQKKLTTLLCDISDGVLVLDKSGQVVLVNAAAEHFLQVQADQVAGLPVSALSIPDLQAAFEATEVSLAPVMREVAGPGGKTLYTTVSPLREIGWVMVMQDITLLKKLDRLRAEWVAAVSHDMKNPLTVLQMALGLLDQTGGLNEDQCELIKKAERSVLSLRLLVSDVLDSARLEGGRPPDRDPVDPAELISQALSQVELLATAKQQHLVSEIADELPRIYGDRTLLVRAMVNLLDNAVKYSPPDSLITVRAWSGNNTLNLQVVDRGSGIPANALPHLFDRSYRVPDGAAQVKGTGLGLTNVKTIVEKHQGQVRVESIPGQGSAFTISLPLRKFSVSPEG